jgi:hypothetical protein
MKLTKKQEKAIANIEDIMKEWKEKVNTMSEVLLKAYWLNPIGISHVIEEEEAMSPEEVFFNWSERGIMPYKTSNIRRLALLMSGHKKIALRHKFAQEIKNL